MEAELVRVLEELKGETRRSTERLGELHEKVDKIDRGLYGSNGTSGVVTKVELNSLRLEGVEKDIGDMQADRRKLTGSVIMAFIGAGLSWIRTLLPGG